MSTLQGKIFEYNNLSDEQAKALLKSKDVLSGKERNKSYGKQLNSIYKRIIL